MFFKNTNKAVSEDHFTGKIFRRLWVPAVVSSVGFALSDIADAVVIGQRLGTVGLAAIALILPVYMISNIFAYAFGIGGSVLYSKLLGQGKVKDAVHSFNYVAQAALFLSVTAAILGNVFMTPLLQILGTVPSDGELFIRTRDYLRILVSAIPLYYFSIILNSYLRCDDNEKLAGVGSVVANLTDITLNIIFVLVLGMGTMGAALSTAIGQIVAIVCYLPGVIGRSHILQIKLVKPKFRVLWDIFKSGFSESIVYLYQLIFIYVSNNILIRIGSESAVAVFDIVQNSSYLIIYLYEGTNRAMLPLLSTYFGEHRRNETKNALKIALKFGFAVGVGMAALIFIFPNAICALFGLTDASVIPLAEKALRIYCIGSVFAGASLMKSTYFQTVERESDSMMILSLRGGFILIPVMILFSLAGVENFWWLFPITEIITVVFGSQLIYYINKKRHKVKFDRERIWTGRIHEKVEDISTLTAEVEAFCEKWEAMPKQQYFMTMTVEETCLAILQNGYPNGGECLIDLVLVAEEDGLFSLHIRDNAVHFNPFDLKTAKLGSKDEDVDMDAMGMMVIKKRSKEFFYRQYGGFNSLVVKV